MHRVACLMFAVLAACGGGSSGTGPNPPGGAGTFTAVIDGQAWVSTTNQTAGSGSGAGAIPGYITITGTHIVSATSNTTLLLVIGYISGPGTYPLGVNQITTAGGGGTVSSVQGSAFSTWATGFPGDAGTVTVTSLTASRIVGTFAFNAPAQPFTSATGTKVVTNGAFNMPLPAGFTIAPPDNKGSKLSATIAGTSWNAATVISLGGNGVFSLGATNDSYTLNITPGTSLSAGNTYPIGAGSGMVSMIVTRIVGGGSWTSGVSGQVGTFTVTSFTGTRATGTFAATLPAGSGGTGTLAITNGTFDVRVNSP